MGLSSYINFQNLKALGNSQSRLKIRNFVSNKIDRVTNKKVMKSFPYSASLNVTNVCNLRCRFCEIHYFYKKAKDVSGKVFPNHLTADVLKNHSDWLKHVISMELSGASGEPFANPNIIEVIGYLKRLGIKLSATTNGLLIDEKVAEQLVKNSFDSLLFSVHAGDSRTYADLQGGDFDNFLARVKFLVNLKKQLRSNYPRININFALNKENAHSVKDLMKLAKDVGVDTFTMNHYYDCRNALDKDISFYFDVDRCNGLLKDAYDYARDIGLKMTPSEPPLLSALKESDFEPVPSRHCQQPWTAIKFKGCVEYENCEYVSVCNRILLFRIEYKNFYANRENSFHKNIWNSGVLQFLRATVNSKESNHVCRFCRDSATPKIRCLDNVEYSRRRDKAIRDFFTEFKKSGFRHEETEGLTLLDSFPYEYDEKDGF